MKKLSKSELMLTLLAAAEGKQFSPVQIQKAAFLATRNLSHALDANSVFEFRAYDYGPFDRAVYDEAQTLSLQGLAEISPSSYGRWNCYSASQNGIKTGNELLATINEGHAKYIREVVDWVRKQSFSGLVKSVYELYPEMKLNSVFRS